MTSRRPYDPAYHKRWRLDRHRGVARLVDASKARVHIEALAMQGASYRGIADRAGVSLQAVCHIRDGQPTAKAAIVKAILAVTYESLFDRVGHEDFVPAIGVVRRLQALMAMGHSGATIGATVGKPPHWVYNAMHAQGRWRSREKWELVVKAYDELSLTPGTSAKTRRLAAKSGYQPPLAWDDDELDDPYAMPQDGIEPDEEDQEDEVDEAAVVRLMAGERIKVSEAEWDEALRRLVSQSLSDEAIAKRLDITSRTVLRQRQALGLESRWSA